MGEAKRRGKLRERVLEKTPFCIYCGVTTPATQVDHMPPRTMFDLRDRSEGLEFGACSECNQGSRHFELAASMLSRIYPDPTTEQGKEEVAKLFKTVKNRWPELLVEMQPDGRQLARFEAARSKLPGTAHVLSAKGPLLNNALRHFSAKLGIALHCDRTGKVLPEAGVIAVSWYTNFQSYTGGIPDTIGQMVGPVDTLRQGSKEVGSQFAYKWATTSDGSRGAYIARFRESFLTVALVSDRPFDVQAPDDFEGMFAPGFLRSTG